MWERTTRASALLLGLAAGRTLEPAVTLRPFLPEFPVKLKRAPRFCSQGMRP